MFTFTDFFIVTPEEEAALPRTKAFLDHLPRVLAQAAIFRDLNGLRVFVEGQVTVVSECWDISEPPPVEKHDNPWFGRVPATLCARLVRADDPQLDEWAWHWSLQEDWRDTGIPLERIKMLLKYVAGLARKAEAAGSVLYVWWCRFEPSRVIAAAERATASTRAF